MSLLERLKANVFTEKVEDRLMSSKHIVQYVNRFTGDEIKIAGITGDGLLFNDYSDEIEPGLLRAEDFVVAKIVEEW